jgi:hypothetical protein
MMEREANRLLPYREQVWNTWSFNPRPLWAVMIERLSKGAILFSSMMYGLFWVECNPLDKKYPAFLECSSKCSQNPPQYSTQTQNTFL